MAWRLNDFVIAGDLNNTRKNSVWGYLYFRNRDRPVMINLTGNCGQNLQGKRLHFEVRDPAAAPVVDFDYENFAKEQIGPIGTCAICDVRNIDCSIDEVIDRNQQVESPEQPTKPRMYMEWYSQNGRVVLELIDPILEVDDGDDSDLEGLPDDLSQIDVEVSDDLELLEDGDEFDLHQESLEGGTVSDELSYEGEDSDEADDPYGLFPESFQAELDSQFESSEEDIDAEDEEIVGLGVDEDTMRLWEKWDEMFSGAKDVPMREIFDPPMKLFPADKLTEEQVAVAFDAILMRLAIHGVALDMCEHFTPREGYKLLVEQILPEDAIYPDLVATNYVYHYSTAEYCPQCQAESDAQHEADNPRHQQGEFDDDSSNEDLPF